MGRGEDRVFGAVDAAVAVDGPGGREELHGPLGADGARAGHSAEIGLDEVDRRQVEPCHAGGGLGSVIVGPQRRQALGRNDPPRRQPGARWGQRHQVYSRLQVGRGRGVLRRRHPGEYRVRPAGVGRCPQAGELDDQRLPAQVRRCGSAASARSAVVSWAASRAGSSPTAGTLNGAATPEDGRGRDSACMLCPVSARLGRPTGPPEPATAQPATGPASTTQAAASNGSLPSQPRDPDTAFNLARYRRVRHAAQRTR